MNNITKITKYASKRYDGWEIYWSTKFLVFCIDQFGSTLISCKQQRYDIKGWIYVQRGGFIDWSVIL